MNSRLRGSTHNKIVIAIAGLLLFTPLACTLEFAPVSNTIEPAATPSSTPRPCAAGQTVPHPTRQPTSEPGLVLCGCVRISSLDSGPALEGVEIYRAFASYDGALVATTDASGCYESAYQFIPGDEMVRVYAVKEGYTFQPEFAYWRHYYGYEVHTVDFVAESVK